MASFWLTLEAFRDVALLQAVRDEVKSCMQTGSDKQHLFDVARLIRQPLLQAMFAENLRLRVHGFLVRRPEKDMQINKWTIPRDHWCIASSTPASMDPDLWCAGDNSAHPVDQFWPGRFLKKRPRVKCPDILSGWNRRLLGTVWGWGARLSGENSHQTYKYIVNSSNLHM